MAVVFAVRGDNTDARYSSAGKTPAVLAAVTANAPVSAASGLTGAIGGTVIDFDLSVATSVRYLQYNGRNNTPTKAFSVLCRLAFGVNTGLIGLWNMAAGDSSTFNRVLVYYNGGTLRAIVSNVNTTNIVDISAAWTPTVGTIYDMVFQWDGTTTANAAKIYIDGVLLVQGTGSASLPTDSRGNRTYISLGSSSFDVQSTRIKVNEFVIWDSVIDPTSVALTSGNGSLNGATRTAFVDVASFDGSVYTDPGSANVSSAVGYTFAGVSTTGSLGASLDPGVANVLSGTVYMINGSTLTGTYHNGSYSNPGIANVRYGTSYIYNDSTLTGSMVVPTPASGVAGTLDLNAIKENIQYLLEQCNTTTASPVDLSANLANSKRVQQVLKIHPEMIMPQASIFPLVTCYISGKPIKSNDIATNQLNQKRRATVEVKVVGAIWNDNYTTIDVDPADEDINYLMENIELILRSDFNLGQAVNWQKPTSCEYYTTPLDEQTHLRAGVLTLECDVFY